MGSRRSSEPSPEPSSPSFDDLGPEDELGRLRAIVRGVEGRPGLVRSLPRLQRAHKKELIRRERWTEGALARHPEPRELIRSRRRPGNIDEHGRLVRIFDARRELVDDVHENRVVRHVVEVVRIRLEALDEPEAVELLEELLGAVGQAPFLRNVGPLTLRPTAPTATLAGDPRYRAVYQSWLALER
jgi:predicted component of viral defense system (DUF524 family)